VSEAVFCGVVAAPLLGIDALRQRLPVVPVAEVDIENLDSLKNCPGNLPGISYYFRLLNIRNARSLCTIIHVKLNSYQILCKFKIPECHLRGQSYAL
jgi:hypothetical protein